MYNIKLEIIANIDLMLILQLYLFTKVTALSVVPSKNSFHLFTSQDEKQTY